MRGVCVLERERAGVKPPSSAPGCWAAPGWKQGGGRWLAAAGCYRREPRPVSFAEMGAQGLTAKS